MCGIFGYVGKRNDAFQIVMDGLRILEYRGYDSWGIAYKQTGTVKRNNFGIIKKTGRIPKEYDPYPESSFALGHTRWATHGGVSGKNAHPHTDCSGKIALIHNGIIENYVELKKQLLHKKHIFRSETDTEVAVHLIEEMYKKEKGEDSFLKSVRGAFRMFDGLSAIIAVDYASDKLVAAKNGSPLVIGKGKDENLIASDAHAMIGFTDKVYYLEDGESAEISGNNIRVFDKKGVEKEILYSKLDREKNIAFKGEYPHFMLKEIFDQAGVIRNIIKNGKQVRSISNLIRKSYGTYLVGCGTAAYACLAGTYLFSKIARRHVNFSVASEFGALLDFITSRSLVIAMSQSGETIDVIESIKKAKKHDAVIASFVNVKGSTLFRISDENVLLEAGTEKAVVSTKAFTAKLAYLLLIAMDLDNKISEGKKLLQRAINSVGSILREENLFKIRTLAERLKKSEHIYVIGRGIAYPIALETALKIKEASYIHAEGFAAGELKHGVIALIEKGTPCIAIIPEDDMYAENLAGAMELKARGGMIIGISSKPNEIFDYYLNYTDCSSASVIPAVVVGQLLGYFLAVERGLDPDMPRNLAKSVTVK